MENMIETSYLCKSYDNTPVVRDINLTVKKGTIYGLLGENGAGKTTIFKMLSGLIRPTSGTALLLGKDISTHREEIQRSLGIMVDVPVFYEDLSATDNIKLHLAYMDKRADVDAALGMVGLIDTGNRPVRKFSLGMRQRLAIARALVHSPELLILDEPTNGLDPAGILAMRTLFTKLSKESGMTILISSHILTEVEHVADTIGLIAKGAIVHEGTLDEIRATHAGGLEEYYMSQIGGQNHV